MGTLPVEKCGLENRPLAKGWGELCITALAFYSLTSIVVLLGVEFGHDFLKLPTNGPPTPQDVVKAFVNWDGAWYESIMVHGYRYDPKSPSSVAFFPAYPILGSIVAASGVRPDLALVLAAHASLAGAFIALAAYARQRFSNVSRNLVPFVLLAFGLLPTTFFFRVAYSESLFVFVSILALYGMERHWPLVAIAGLVGLATATRPVAVALLAPLLLHIRKEAAGVKGFIRLAWAAPLACWGIIGYAVYLYFEFGAPLAFVQAQENWRLRPPVAFATKLADLVVLEPVTANFDRASPCYWWRPGSEINVLFSLYVANPLYWLSAVGLIVLGACKRWLSGGEVALALCLLFIPYGSRSHEMCMASMGRFASAVFPMYLVLGHILCRVPTPLAACFLGISGFFLGAYAALFAAWYKFF